MVMHRVVLLLGLSFFLITCNAGKSDQATAQENPKIKTNYPSVPLETLEMLWEKCDFVDYIFYEHSFSLSQSEKFSIQKSLQHIAEELPDIKPECKPTGRIFYQVDGQNVLEADFFFSPGCLYFLFYKDGKKAYANSMTPEGFQFFQNIFQHVNENAPSNQ